MLLLADKRWTADRHTVGNNSLLSPTLGMNHIFTVKIVAHFKVKITKFNVNDRALLLSQQLTDVDSEATTTLTSMLASQDKFRFCWTFCNLV